MKDFDEKVKSAAREYALGESDLCHFVDFIAGANFARELLQSEVDRLKEVVKWNLQNNDEYGCEFLGITIVRDENIKLKADLALAVDFLKDLESTAELSRTLVGFSVQQCVGKVLAKIRASD